MIYRSRVFRGDDSGMLPTAAVHITEMQTQGKLPSNFVCTLVVREYVTCLAGLK